MQNARRFGGFFETSKQYLKSKCLIERSVGTERIERTLLQTYRKLKTEESILMAFAD